MTKSVSNQLIYLDNHSTTRCDPRVIDAMLPLMTEGFGNPHSTTHRAGQIAREATAVAMRQIAEAIGATSSEIVVTSGATESCNLALLGHCLHPRNRRRNIVTAVTEHPAVLDPVAHLEQEQFRITRLEMDRAGRIDIDDVRRACNEGTAIISIMLANNEIGVLQDLETVIEIAHDFDIPVHTDATQAVGRIPVDLERLEVDLLSASAHKFYGPKGVGFLYVRRRGRRARLRPLMYGGGQQRGSRPGTMNPAAVVGMAEALRLSIDGMSQQTRHVSELRSRLVDGLQQHIPGISINGPPLDTEQRLPGNLNVLFPGVEGEALMVACPELAVSSGSACSSVDPRPSHVLMGIGLSEQQARSSLRFGVGRFNTEDEIDKAVDMLSLAYQRLRQLGL